LAGHSKLRLTKGKGLEGVTSTLYHTRSHAPVYKHPTPSCNEEPEYEALLMSSRTTEGTSEHECQCPLRAGSPILVLPSHPSPFFRVFTTVTVALTFPPLRQSLPYLLPPLGLTLRRPILFSSCTATIVQYAHWLIQNCVKPKVRGVTGVSKSAVMVNSLLQASGLRD
jgi:hypothetical protein